VRYFLPLPLPLSLTLHEVVATTDTDARDNMLAIFARGNEAVVAWLAPLFTHLSKATHMGAPSSSQSNNVLPVKAQFRLQKMLTAVTKQSTVSFTI
jgi:hypothetical protein